jgi:choline monooxygenase
MTFEINPNIAKASTIHTDFYTKKTYFEAAKEKIFAQSWQFIGDIDRLEATNVFPFTLLENYLDEPLLLSKDKNGKVRCLSNVCTHRGNLVAYAPCQSSQLRCKYHGRVFGLDGKFIFMPEFEQVENFPCKADNLTELPLFKIGKLLFTTLNFNTPTAPFFAAMLARINFMPLDKMVFRKDLSQTYDVKANWALYCENYLEGFHIPFIHNGLNAVIDYGNYATEIFEYCNLQLGIGKKSDTCFDLPAHSPDFGKMVEAYYFWVFPNMMFNFYPWGLSFNLVEPQGIDETKVHFLVYVWDENKLEKGAGAGLNQVELEDEEVVENVQRGIRSRFYSQGRYAPNREQGPHHFHSLIAQFLQQNEQND